MHNSTGYLSYVADLLAVRDVVFIPGFGGFVTRYKSASINRHSGYIHPPTKYIAFNEKLNIHNNEFAQYIDEQTDAHYSPRLFDQFVSDLQSSLKSNEVILIPDVGRIYQDYDGVTHFMPDLGNLNTNAYGLPTLHFEPIIASQTLGTTTSKPLEERNLIPRIGIAAGIALIALISWLLVQNDDFDQSQIASGGRIDTVNEMNVLPEFSESEKIKNKGQVQTIDVSPSESIVNADVEEYNTNTAKERAYDNNLQNAVIIVGAFGDKRNVEKMSIKVKSQGYDVFQDSTGKLTRIGVKVSYSNRDELKKILQKVQDEIASKAWVL